ncbi:MAG: hypothetical protein FE045_03355 [Thermoplasmata archaeon]|nr:MAG: hypothetical protein FE045_03355 [Thermoplasmata archaeon]
MRQGYIVATLVPLFFVLLSSFALAEDNKENEGMLWIISNNELVEKHANIVVADKFYIFHTYDYISIRYYEGNETFFSSSKHVGKIVELSLHDGATLEIKHGNETLLSCVTHKATLGNILKYKAGITYQSSITSIILAFIAAIAVNVAYYYNLETRIL